MSTTMTVDDLPMSDLSITTVRFGAPEDITVSAASLFSFPDAVPGLPESHRFALVVDPAYEPLRWLQSLDEMPFCLPVVPLAALAQDDYVSYVAQAIASGEVFDTTPGVDGTSELEILLVTRFDEAVGLLAVNMLAPVILDGRSATGRQIVLDVPPSHHNNGQPYPLRQHVSWDAESRTFKAV